MNETKLAGEEGLLLNLARQVGNAWAIRDVGTLAQLIDDPYFHTDVNGRTLGRTEWLSYVPGHGRGPAITFDDVKVDILGDLAVITGRNVVTMLSDGKAVNRALRFTQVWRRRGLEWRRAVFQATWIAPK